MKKFALTSTLAVLLGAVSYSAWAQTAQNPPPPPPAEEQLDGDADQRMADDGCMGGGGQHGMHRMYGRHGHGGPGGMRGMGRMIDANGDSVIGDSEAAVLADHGFQRLDRDASGDLDEAEFTTVRKRGGWWRWTQAQNEGVSEGLKAKFATLDADKNSKVSKAEFMSDAQTRFAAADTNKDGKVSPWEFFAQN
jgi:hypothetical protein